MLAVSLKAYIRIHAVALVLFSRQSGLLCSRVMPDPSQAQVPTTTVSAAQAVLENSSADTSSSAEASSTVANQETLEVNIFSFVYCFVVIFSPSRPFLRSFATFSFLGFSVFLPVSLFLSSSVSSLVFCVFLATCMWCYILFGLCLFPILRSFRLCILLSFS